jgi:hypothetical protein
MSGAVGIPPGTGRLYDTGSDARKVAAASPELMVFAVPVAVVVSVTSAEGAIAPRLLGDVEPLVVEPPRPEPVVVAPGDVADVLRLCAMTNRGSLLNERVTCPAFGIVPSTFDPDAVTSETEAPTAMAGSVIATVSGLVDAGTLPLAALHATANDVT